MMILGFQRRRVERESSNRSEGARKIRVLCVAVSRPTLTGAQNMLAQLLAGLERSDKISCSLVCTDATSPMARRCREAGVNVIEEPYRGPLNTFGQRLLDPLAAVRAIPSYIAYGWRLRRRIRECAPDIILAGNARALLPLVPFPKRGESIIWNIFLGRRSAGVWGWINEIALLKADVVVTEYQGQARDIFTTRQYARNKKKVVTVHTGIDLQRFPAKVHKCVPSRPVKLAFIGTVCARKGIDVFLEAAAIVAESGTRIEVLVAGARVDEGMDGKVDALCDRVIKAGASVRFLGWVDDVECLLREVDVFVLSSRSEGMPGIVRQAMASAVPVVAADVGGVREALGTPPEGGIVVPIGDPVATAEAVNQLARSPRLREEMGGRGRQRVVRHFTSDAYIREMDRLISHIIAARLRL